MTHAERPLVGQVVRMAWPAVMHGLLSTVVLFTDRLILGNWDAFALSAMHVSGPLLWCSFSLFGAYGAGVLAVVGRAFGAKDVIRVRRTLGTAMAIALAAGIAVGLLGYLSRESLANILTSEENTSKQTLGMAGAYLGIVFLSAPFQMLGATATVGLQSLGDTRTPMYVSILSGLTNLGLTYVLVYGLYGLPELGIKGAAIGTAASFFINACLLNLRLMRGRIGYGFGRPTISNGRQILRVAWPAFLEKALFHTAYLAFVLFIGHLGDQAMQAHQAIIAIESLGFIGAHAFGIAAGALVAQHLGADRPGDAARVGHISARLGIAVLSLVGLLFFGFAPHLISMFSQDPNVIRVGTRCLQIAAIAQPLMAISDVYAGALRGAGDTVTPMLAAIIGPMILRLSVCWLLAFHLEYGLIGIWVGSTVDWAFRSIWLWLAFRRGHWARIKI